MRKKILLIIITPIILLSSTEVNAQKIKSVEIDKFTGKRRIESSRILLKDGLMQTLGVYARSVDTTVFLNFYGNIGVGVVGPNDPITFLLDDKTTIKAYPTSIQSYDISPDSYSQQYIISLSDFKLLKSKLVTSIRRTYGSNYIDLDIKEKASNKLKSLAELFFAELEKQPNS